MTLKEAKIGSTVTVTGRRRGRAPSVPAWERDIGAEVAPEPAGIGVGTPRGLRVPVPRGRRRRARRGAPGDVSPPRPCPRCWASRCWC